MGAPRVLKSTPDEAVVSLDMTVLLMKSTFNASTSETPAPSQPATLLVMILLVTLTEYHCAGVVGKVTTSEPLMFCKRSPPPLPPPAPAGVAENNSSPVEEFDVTELLCTFTFRL